MTRVAEPYDIVVTTNSGYPLDQNLYQGGKGLSAAAGILRDGGAILFASQCADGLPAGSPYARSLERFRTRRHSSPLSSTEVCTSRSSGRARRPRWFAGVGAYSCTRADSPMPRSARPWFEPVADPSACLAALVAEYGPSCRVADPSRWPPVHRLPALTGRDHGPAPIRGGRLRDRRPSKGGRPDVPAGTRILVDAKELVPLGEPFRTRD